MLAAGLWLAAAGAPLVWFTGVVAFFTLPKLVVLAFAVLIASGGAALAYRSGSFKLKSTPLDASLMAAAAVLAVSTFFSQDRLLSFFGMYNYYAYGVWPLGLCAALYYLSAFGLSDEEKSRGVLRACLAAAALVGLYAVLQSVGIEPFSQIGTLLNARAISTLGSPVSLGAYLALALPAALYWALDEKRGKLFGFICLAAIIGGLIASIARAAWLSAAAAFAFYLLLTGRLRGLRLSPKKLVVIVFAGAVLGAVLFMRLSARQTAKLNESARVEIWRAAWISFLEHPWIGSGPDTFELGFRRNKSAEYVKASAVLEYQAHAHNDILEVLVTTGLAGALAYAFFLLSLFKAAQRALGDPRAAALFCGLLALFLNMKFNPVPLEALVLASLFAGILCAPQSREIPRRYGGAALGLCVLASMFSAGLAAHAFIADRQIKAAQNFLADGRSDMAFQRFQLGLNLNPCEMSYHIQYVNFLSARAANTRDSVQRLDLIGLAAKSGEEAVRCHPNSGNAHYALGVAALMQARLGKPERLAVAERELDEALRLDPLFVPLLESRRDAALFGGDANKAIELTRKIGSLTGLAQSR